MNLSKDRKREIKKENNLRCGIEIEGRRLDKMAEDIINSFGINENSSQEDVIRAILRNITVSSVNEFYTALKKKMTGQVINGVLVGCLLESEIEEVYEQFKQSEGNSEKDN